MYNSHLNLSHRFRKPKQLGSEGQSEYNTIQTLLASLTFLTISDLLRS